MYIYKIIDSPVGKLSIIADSALHALVRLTYDCRYICGSASADDSLLCEAEKQLNEYFMGNRKQFNLPIYYKGTAFYNDVWSSLLKIQYGSTATYAEVAESIGRPRAYRAVGLANSNNPLPIIIPCHRVVASVGIGGYTPDIAIKKTLLEVEQKHTIVTVKQNKH